MSDEEVKPLHGPADGISNCYFICNINGEVSLWDINGRPRAYTARAIGTNVENLLQYPEGHIENLRRWPPLREHADILRRNMDAILVYGAMLGEKHSGVG